MSMYVHSGFRHTYSSSCWHHREQVVMAYSESRTSVLRVPRVLRDASRVLKNRSFTSASNRILDL